MSKAKKPNPEFLSYNKNLRAEIETDINDSPRARVHQVEWRKIMVSLAHRDSAVLKETFQLLYLESDSVFLFLLLLRQESRWRSTHQSGTASKLCRFLNGHTGGRETTTSQSACTAKATTPKSITSHR